MTATSGPGFSLMQEGIGYAAITETPCVIVDSQRWGPSTGQPTKTAQGDVMQAIWGTHGDHPVIVLTASHVRDVFEMTVRAFNFAEQYRVPVILLLDEVLSHMRENVFIPEPGEIEIIERKRPPSRSDFRPFRDLTFLPFGDGARFNVTGMAHDEAGFPAQGQEAERQLRRIIDKIQSDIQSLTLFEGLYLDDARMVITSYGITSRAAQSAVEQLRAEGLRIGFLNLKTLWPFPDFLFERLPPHVEFILVPELNLGQLVREVRRAMQGWHGRSLTVEHLGRVDGNLITPQQIIESVHAFTDSKISTGGTPRC